MQLQMEDTQRVVMKSKINHSEAQDMVASDVMENGVSVNKAQNYTAVQTRQQTHKYSHLINR